MAEHPLRLSDWPEYPAGPGAVWILPKPSELAEAAVCLAGSDGRLSCGSRRTTRLKYVLFRLVSKDSLPINFSQGKGSFFEELYRWHTHKKPWFPWRNISCRPLALQREDSLLAHHLADNCQFCLCLGCWPSVSAFTGVYRGIKNARDSLLLCPKQIQVSGSLRCILGPRAPRSDRTNFKSWLLFLICSVTLGE